MGPTISVNKADADIQQNVKNQIVQRNSAVCQYTCSNIANDDTQIIINDRIGGNLDVFNFKCTTNINCNIAQSSSANLTSILAATVSQKNTPANGGWGFTLETGITNEDYTANTLNQVTQITNSTCLANTTDQISNDYFVMANSEVGGNVAFATSDGNTTGNCMIQNISSMVGYNNTQANSDQNNVDSGMWTMIITVIIILVVVGAIVTIFSSGIRGLKGDKASGELTTEQIETISSELADTGAPTIDTTITK